MNRRARTRGAFEVHGQQEIPGQESTQECTQVHAAEVHAPGPLYRGGGHLEDPEEWKERLRLALEKTERERARRKAERLEFQTRRNYGKATYHAAKLARAAAQREENR